MIIMTTGQSAQMHALSLQKRTRLCVLSPVQQPIFQDKHSSNDVLHEPPWLLHVKPDAACSASKSQAELLRFRLTLTRPDET